MNAYFFKVKENDDFLTMLKIESARLKKSMKTFIIEAVKEKIEKEQMAKAKKQS